MTALLPRQGATPAPATPQAPVPGGPADIGTLQTQIGDLRVQQAGLKAEYNGLRRQLDQMLQSNPARPGLQQKWTDVGVQIAKVDGQIATLQAQIAQKQGVAIPGTQPPFIPGRRSGPDPDMVVGMSLGIIMIVAIPLSIAYARRIWRGKPGPAPMPLDQISPRFNRLEQAVDAIAIEVERIAEGQRFVTKIMAERATPKPQPAEAQMPEGKPVLAIGAAPAEPIRVGERQGVNVRNTPH